MARTGYGFADRTARMLSDMRRSIPIALVALAVLVLGLVNGASPVAAAEPLDTLTVFAGNTNPVTSRFGLVQGQEYTVVLTGTAVYSYGSGDPQYADALYLYDIEACPEPCESGHLNYRIGSGDFINSALPGRPPGGPPPAPAYNSDHRYQWTFTAPASGPLSYRDTGGLGPDNSTGTYRIEIYGEGGAPDPDAPTNVAVPEPAPGESVSLQSPDPLPRRGGTVTAGVTNSSGDLKETTVVGEGEIKKIADEAGEAITACWFMGPDAFDIAGKGENLVVKVDQGDPIPLTSIIRGAQENFRGANARFALAICIVLAERIAEAYDPSTTPEPPPSEELCYIKRVALRIRSRDSEVTRVSLAGTQQRPASAPRYTCTSSGPGEMDMTVTHGRDRSLRQDLGTKLDLGVVRQANAEARDATLTFGFN